MSSANVPRYSRVSTCFWSKDRSSQWTDRDTVAGLYLATCPHRHLEGIFILPPQYACADLHWTMKTWKHACTVLQESGFLKWDSRTNVVLIVNALRDQTPENPNQTAAVLRRIRDLPDTPLLQEFCAIALDYCYRKGATPQAQAFAQLLREQLEERFGEQLDPLNLKPLTQPQAKTQSQPQARHRTGDGRVERSVVSTKGGGIRTEGNTEPERLASILERNPHLRETADSKP